MIRFLNVLAIVALIASATAAYSVKYETILVAEKLRKREADVIKERDSIAVLQAEWQLLNRPARLQTYMKPDMGLQPVSVRQIAHASDVPSVKPEVDKIDALLTGSLPADKATKTSGKTPGNTSITAIAPTTPKGATSIKTKSPKQQATPRSQASASGMIKAPMTPRPPRTVAVQAGTAPRTNAIARPMALSPPASIPNAGAGDAKKSNGISSLIGKIMGR